MIPATSRPSIAGDALALRAGGAACRAPIAVLPYSASSLPPRGASDAAIGVESPEDVVAEIGEDDGAEGDEEDDGAPIAAPASQGAGVQVDAVDEPGEEGGGLF